MESTRDGLLAILLLRVTAGAIVGTLLIDATMIDATMTVAVLLLAVVINSAMLIQSTPRPKG